MPAVVQPGNQPQPCVWPARHVSAVTCIAQGPAYSNQVQADVLSSSQLGVSPTSVNFGSIAVGSSAPQTATLTNSGPDTLTVSQANVTGTGFSISGLSLPL